MYSPVLALDQGLTAGLSVALLLPKIDACPGGKVRVALEAYQKG
jgi:hypothetical protein